MLLQSLIICQLGAGPVVFEDKWLVTQWILTVIDRSASPSKTGHISASDG